MTAPPPEPPEPPRLFLNPATHTVHLDQACPGYRRAKYGTPINSMPKGADYTMCARCSAEAVETFIDSTRI